MDHVNRPVVIFFLFAFLELYYLFMKFPCKIQVLLSIYRMQYAVYIE